MDEDLCVKIARTDLSLTGSSSDMATIMSGVATTVEDFLVGAEDGLAPSAEL